MEGPNDFLSGFLIYLISEKRASAHTCKAYKEDLNQLQVFLFGLHGDADWSEVSSQEIRRYLVWLQHRGLAKSSINRKISAIRSFFRFLLKKGHAIQQPLKDIRNLKVPQKTPRFLTPRQAEGLENLNFPEGFLGLRDQVLMSLFLWTGMRSAELAGLDWRDVDTVRALLRVTGKGRKTRLIPLHPILIKQLDTYLEKRKGWLEEMELKETRLFLTDRGAPLSGSWLYKRVKKYTRALTTESYRGPHLLRHSFATWLLNEGADIQAVKELLGHASLAATQVYTHVSLDTLRETYRKAHPKGGG